MPKDLTIEQLIELMRDPARSSSIIFMAISELPTTPQTYMDVALRAADVLIKGSSALSSFAELKAWVMDGEIWQQSCERLTVIATAFESLQLHNRFPSMDEIGFRLLEAAEQRHGERHPIRDHGGSFATLSVHNFPQLRQILEEQGWEAMFEAQA